MPDIVEPLSLAGASNFRDIGGWRVPGGSVAPGLVFRSNQLARLTAEDFDRLDRLDIAAVVDLRSARERAAQPTARFVGKGADHISLKPDTDFIFSEIFAATERTAAAWGRAFGRFYISMLESYADEFTTFFRLIAEGELPLVVHCSAGKDRTGAACGMLLELLGVDREDIVIDYLTSSVRLRDDAHFTNMMSDAKLTQYEGLPLECRQVMLGTDRAHITGLLDAIDARFGSIDGYLRDRLGLNADQIAQIRAGLLKPDA